MDYDQIFTGILLFTTDNFLLQPPGPQGTHPFIDVTPTPRLLAELRRSHYHHQMVSILGHMGHRPISRSAKISSLIAEKVALQKEIAVRAYFIYKSGHGGSALDNWLRAEREQLEEHALKAVA